MEEQNLYCQGSTRDGSAGDDTGRKESGHTQGGHSREGQVRGYYHMWGGGVVCTCTLYHVTCW